MAIYKFTPDFGLNPDRRIHPSNPMTQKEPKQYIDSDFKFALDLLKKENPRMTESEIINSQRSLLLGYQIEHHKRLSQSSECPTSARPESSTPKSASSSSTSLTSESSTTIASSSSTSVLSYIQSLLNRPKTYFDTWFNSMSDPYKYGDNVTLQAAADLFNLNIHVKSSGGEGYNQNLEPNRSILNHHKDNPKDIYLYHEIESHYQQAKNDSDEIIERSTKSGECQFSVLAAELDRLGIANKVLSKNISYLEDSKQIVSIDSSVDVRNAVLAHIDKYKDNYKPFIANGV